MPRIPGVSWEQAVRAFRTIGYVIVREGKHTVMSNGATLLTIPRHNPHQLHGRHRAFGMLIVIKLNGVVIIEYRANFLERDTMLFEISASLSGIPKRNPFITTL